MQPLTTLNIYLALSNNVNEILNFKIGALKAMGHSTGPKLRLKDAIFTRRDFLSISLC